MAIRDMFSMTRKRLEDLENEKATTLSPEAQAIKDRYLARHQNTGSATVQAAEPVFTPAVPTVPSISGDTVTRVPAKNRQAAVGSTTVTTTTLSPEAQAIKDRYLARKQEKQEKQTETQRTELLGGLAEQTGSSYNDLMQRVTEFGERNTDPRKANTDEIAALRKEISDLSTHYRDYGNAYDTTYDGSPSGQFLAGLNAADAALAQMQNRKRTWDEMSPFEQLAATAREKIGDRAEAYEEYLATDYDIDAAKRQVGDLQNQLDEIKRSTFGNAEAPTGDRYDAEAAYAEKRQKMTDLETRIGQLEAEIGNANEIRAERAEAEEYDRVMAPYRALTTSQQFAENNGYHSTRHGESVRNDFSGVYTDTGFDDILHDYINRNPDAIKAQIAITTNDNTAFLGIAPTQLAFLTDEERDIYNYLYNVQGKEPAQEFLKSIGSYLNKRNREAEAREWTRIATENPISSITSNIVSVPLNAIGGVLGSAAAAADRMQGKEIDQNAGEFRLTRIPAEIRGAVAEKISDTWAGDTGSFLYQTGMSMADFLFTTAVTGGFSGGGKVAEALNLGIMGSTAAANSVIEAKDAGMDDRTAFIIGAIAGAAEIITEKISLESLLDKTNLDKSVRGYILKNILSEGSEEAASDLINIAADIIIAGDQGTFATDVREHGAAQAVLNRLKEIGLDALGGAISGGVMAGAGVVINSGIGDTIRNTGPIGTYRAGQDIVQSGQLSQLIDESQTFAPETRAYRLGAELNRRFAAKGIDLGTDAEKIGVRATYDVGRLANRVERQTGRDVESLAILRQAAEDMAAEGTVSEESANAVLADRGARRELGLTGRKEGDPAKTVTDALTRYRTAQERETANTANDTTKARTVPQRSVNQERSVAIQARDTNAVNDFADSLGKAGKTVVSGLYDAGTDAERYIPAANDYYRAGVRGDGIETVETEYGSVLTEEVKQQIYDAGVTDAERQNDQTTPEAAEKEKNLKAGQTDAIAVDTEPVTAYNSTAPVTANINEEGNINVRSERTAPVRGDQVGTYSPDSGVADQSVRAGAEARGVRAETAESGRAQQVNYGQVAGKEVRISDLMANGSRNRFVKVVDAGWYSTDLNTDNAATKSLKAEMRKAESDLKTVGVENVRFVVGAIVKNNYRTVRGITSGDGKTVTVRIDHQTRNVTEIAKHEEYHIRSSADPNLSDTIRERIVSRYTETDIRNMVDAYVSEYGWTNMSDDQILEEILADAYAGINILDYLTETQGATRYSEIARGSVGTDNYGVVAGRDQASEDTIRERRAEFGDELDNIYAAEMQARDPNWYRQRPERWRAKRSAGNNSEVVPLSTIIREISQKFGINITTGFVNGRGVLGTYNLRNKGIRSRMEQNLPTIAHELGHALSDRYGALSKLTKEARQELVRAMPVSFTANYSKAEIPEEGIAEFMRRFLQNPTEERNRCPKAVTEFLNILSETDRDLIMHLADEVNALMADDNNSIQDSMRLLEDKAKDYRTAGEKAREKFDAFTTAWVDSFAPINKFQQRYGGKSYILAANSRYAAARAARIIEGWDLRDMHGKSVGTGLRGALAGVDTTNRQEYNDFGEYLIVKHAQERLAEGQRIVANDAKNNIAWMQKRQAELEAKYPQFADASERLYEFERQFLRAYGVRTGVVDSVQVQQWEARWHSYVPFYRAQDDGKNYGARRGFANQTSPIKRAIGSGKDIIHPVDNIVSFIIKMTNIGIRNDVMRELVRTAETAGANAMFLERIPDQMVTTAVSTQPVVDEVTNNAINYGLAHGMSKDDIVDLTNHMIEDLSDNLFRRILAPPKDDIVTVMRGGKPEYWKVNDKQLLGAITALSKPRMKGFVEAYAKTTRFMTAMITGSNPVWSIFSNSVRDLMTLAVYSPERNPIKVIRGIASSYLNSFRESYGNQDNLSEYYAEYLAMGGGNASVYTADMDVAKRARQNWGKSKWQRYKMPVVGWGKALIDGVSFLSNTIERGPRYATYLNARQNGMTPEEAFRMAMDVTVDFARAGTASRQVNAFVQFFNAGIQGIDKAARFFTASDMAGSPAARKKSVIIRNSTMVAVSAALAGIIHALNHGNDDRERDYQQNLATYTKNNYWCIPIGDGKFFTIPKARELSTLESFFERLYELSSGNDHAFTDFYGYVIDNFFPGVVSDVLSLPENVANQGSGKGSRTTLRTAVGSLGLIGQIAYYGGNYDYLGRPIVSESLEGLEPKFQYDDSTSKMAYWIGQAFNLSPKRIDYLGKNILGYVWKLPSAILPLGADRVDWTFGVANTYVRDSEYSTDLVNWLYDSAEKSAIYARSYKDDLAGQLQNKRDADMKTFYSRFNGLNRTNGNENSKRANRQIMLNRIVAYRADADNGYVSEVNEILNEIVASTKDTSILPGVMQTYITYQTTSGKEKIDHRVDLTDLQYLQFQQVYENEYAFLIRQIPASAKSETEKAQYLKNAKTVAKGRAESAILQNAGIGKSDLDKKYYGVLSDELAEFRYLIDKADDDDGGVDQDEVRAILENLIREGMAEDTAEKLWKSRGYKSDR